MASYGLYTLLTATGNATGTELTTGNNDQRTFQAVCTGTGAVTATVTIQGSLDKTNWVTITTLSLSGTAPQTASYEHSSAWTYIRATSASVTGTGATVNVYVALNRKREERISDTTGVTYNVTDSSVTVDLVGTNPKVPEMSTTGYGVTSAGGGGVFHSRAARGTEGAPAAVQSGDFLGGYGSKGYDGTTFTGSSSAAVHFVADQGFSGAAHGTSMRFLTTPNNSTVSARLIRQAILADGQVILGGAYTAGTVLSTLSPAGVQVEVLHNRATRDGVSLFDTRAWAQGVGGALAFSGYRGTTNTSKYAAITGTKENGSLDVTTGSLSLFVNDGTNATSMREVLRIASTGNAILGNGDLVAAPSSQTLRSPNAAGTDIAGGSLTLAGGRGTGTGAGGSVIFQTAPAAGSTGSALNTAVERFRIKQGGQIRFVPLAAAPTLNVEDGDVYYDSGTSKLRVRAASTWVDLH